MKNLHIPHRNITITIMILLLTTLAGLSFYDYDYKNRQYSEQNLQELSKKNNETLNHSIENKLNDMEVTLASFALIASQYDDITDPDLLQLLAKQSSQSEFLRLAITTSDGRSHTSDGLVHDSSDRSYYKESMAGKTFISEVLVSRVDQRNILCMSVPITKDNVIVGLLRNTIDITSLQELMHLAPITDGLKSMIVDRNGAIVTTTANQKNDNYFSILKNAKFDEDQSLQQMRSAFAKGQSGVVRYTVDGKTNYAYFSPVAGCNWVIVTTLPYQLINKQLSKNYETTTYLTVKLFSILVIIILYIIWNERKNQKLQVNMNRKLDAIINNSPGCMMRYNIKSPQDVNFLNDAFFKLCGYTKEEFNQLFLQDTRSLIYQEDRNMLEERMQKDITSGQQALAYNYRIQHKNGKLLWVADHRQVVTDENQVTWIYATLVDITDSKNMQEKLRISQERYQMIIEQTESVVFEWDVKKDKITLSDLWKKKFGYTCVFSDFLMLTEACFSREENTYIPLMEALIRGQTSGQIECKIKKANNEYIWCKITARSITDSDGYLMTIIGSIEDIDEAKEKTMQLEEKTKLDGMTHVLNKTTAETFMEHVLLSDPDKQHILFVIDVDDFKHINDSLGHASGDEVLCAIANSIRECFRDDDLIGRIGGDEFTVLMKDVGTIDPHLLQSKIDHLHASLSAIIIDGQPTYKVTCSIGIASYPESALTYADLFKSADKALYEVKKSGKNNYVYHIE